LQKKKKSADRNSTGALIFKPSFLCWNPTRADGPKPPI
jgi:hypothetical protein